MLILDTEPIECSHLIGHWSPFVTKRYVDLEIIPTKTHLRFPRKSHIRRNPHKAPECFGSLDIVAGFPVTMGPRFTKPPEVEGNRIATGNLLDRISHFLRRCQSLQGRTPRSGRGGSGSIAMNSSKLLSGSRKKTEAAGIQASTTGSCVGAPAKSLG